mgnify:CR=1 FL=1
MTKSLIVFCPNPYSLYTNSVCELLIRRGYTIDAIVIKKFTITRFQNEFKRDGKRLLKKIWKKLVLRDTAYTGEAGSIVGFRKEKNLTIKNVEDFKKHGTNIVYCKSLNDAVVEETLKRYDEKLIIFTGGGIIRKNILDLAGDGIINCHMGILPRYKGMDLPEWCILENRFDQFGLTLHFMDSGIDTGKILQKVSIPLGNSSSIKSLRNRFEPVMVDSMVNTVENYLRGELEPQTQPTGENRQYFIVHKRLYEIVDKKIARHLGIKVKD